MPKIRKICFIAAIVVCLLLQGELLLQTTKKMVAWHAEPANYEVNSQYTQLDQRALQKINEYKNIFPFPFFDKDRKSKFAVDILSIASLTRLGLAKVQHATWATHLTARYFWNATELDDPDPECSYNKTMGDVEQWINACKSSFPGMREPSNALKRHFRLHYARLQWIQKKANPAGWLCAQTRPGSALAKLGHTYRCGLQNGIPLPDYVFVLDDDSFVNMEIFEKTILESEARHQLNHTADTTTSSIPVVYAGCLIRSPIHMINQTFPFGGWGSYWSKGALERFIKPIFCNHTGFRDEVDEFERNVCRRIQEDVLDEKQLFTDGMSVSDLMGVFSNAYPLCYHSDWIIGYFVNYYFLSKHVENPYFKDVEHARFHALDESEVYRRSTGNCVFDGQKCGIDSHVCHYMNETLMENLFSQIKMLYSDKFK